MFSWSFHNSYSSENHIHVDVKYVMTLFAWQRYRYENEEISVVDRSRHSVDPLTPTGKIETSQNHIIVKISPISELQNTLFYKISHWIGLMTKIHMNRPKDPRQQSTKVEKLKIGSMNFLKHKKSSKSVHKPKSYTNFCELKKHHFFSFKNRYFSLIFGMT